MEPNREELDKYLKDLKEIKDLVSRHEERPVVAYWDFIAWGFLVILGTLIHSRFFPAELNKALLIIWLPVLILGGAVETVAWFYTVKKFDTLIQARQNLRFYLAVMIICISISLVFYFIIHLHGPIPGILLLLLAVLFAMVAQRTYMALFIETVMVLTAGIVLTFLDLEGSGVMTLTGLFAGFMFISMGIHSKILEKRNG